MKKTMLRSKMMLNGDDGGDLAKALGISRSSLSAKMNAKSQFTQAEIYCIKNRYSLKSEEIDLIFF